MTTYFLHGGRTSVDNKENDEFFHQFTNSVAKPVVKILLCYWAREKSEWDTLSKRDFDKIIKNSQKLVEIHIVEDINDLFRKLPEFDVLYISGGENKLLEPYYPDLKNLKNKLKGKIFIGSSMGAFIAAKKYVLSYDSQDTETVHRGLGLVPYQILCHWNVENHKEEKKKLLEADSTLPILMLEESKFVKIVS